MSLWRMIFTNLRRHRVRTLIGMAGIALGVATMLSVVGLLGGAVRMFERILRNDSELLVFEKNVCKRIWLTHLIPPRSCLCVSLLYV